MNQTETQINHWLDELERIHGREAGTVRNYHGYLKRFLAWSQVTAAKEIDRVLIDRYRLWLGSQRGRGQAPFAASTKNYHLIALRAFLSYLRAHQQPTLPAEQVRLFTVRTAAPAVLATNELEALLAAPMKADEAEIIRFRDKALLELLFATGLRVAELSALTKASVGETVTIQSAGKPERRLTLTNQSRYWLEHYRTKRSDNSPALFVRLDRARYAHPLRSPATTAKRGERSVASEAWRARGRAVTALTPRSIQRLIRRYAAVAGLSRRITPRMVRATVAHRLLAAGADVRTVQKKLGHAATFTTQRYRHATVRER